MKRNLVLLYLLISVVYGEVDVDENLVESECMKVDECTEVEEEECGICHSMFMPECTKKMESKYTPIMVEECKELDEACDEDGRVEKCYTKYFTECSTNSTMMVEEDRPICGVEEQEKCTDDDGCKMMKVMKCKLEKKMIRKENPGPTCETTPTTVCKRVKCRRKQCFERVVMNRQTQPRERCHFKEKRVCHQTDNSTCRTVKRKKCMKIQTNKPCEP